MPRLPDESLLKGRTIVAIILALGASVSIILLIIETIQHVGTITAQESTVISTSLGAIIGAVAVYLGGHSATNGSNNADQQSAGRMEIRETRQNLQEPSESRNPDAGDQSERGPQA